MEEVATIDAAGRLVVPKAMRERLGLRQGARVRLREGAHHIVIEPMLEESVVVEVDGLPVVRGRLVGEVVDHRVLRDQRTTSLTPRRR
jgi:AbrB family looped-hinge helix DNA binding protein